MSVPRPTSRALGAALGAALAGAALALPAPAARAQLVVPKTLPVAQGGQFDIFPSSTVGMGGVRIAVADTMLDPFINPAKSTRLGETRLFSAPIFYSISGQSGGGRTIPIGGAGRLGAWTGVATVAFQQLDKGEAPFAQAERLSDRTAVNEYAAAALGRRLGASAWSVGASGFVAGLDAVDGVNLLYNGSDRIDQAGHMVDVRAGLTRDWADGRTLELLVVHNRYAMTHDVTWTTWRWDPAPQRAVRTERLEHNEDRTNAWGLHAEYERPIATNGWRVGYLATATRLSHPKIPNYSVMNIPRDPGTTYAYNLGVGVARSLGAATVAVDMIYEPIWSETWADAASDTTGRTGVVIPRGGKTVENQFRFSNAVLRMGVGREATLGEGDKLALGVRAGVAAHSISYRLEQQNNIEPGRRNQRERWIEWTPTWGVSFRFPEIALHYRGHYTTGVGRPGVAPNMPVPDAAGPLQSGGGIIAAPSAPLTLQNVHVVGHQVSFSLPLK
jgi:hypothetical protein